MHKIYFRYLFVELLKPLLFCVVACSSLWIIFDLFSSLSFFIEQKTAWTLILDFYFALIPKMLVDILPVALLFASLYTVLTFSRRQELIAMQAGGIGWFQIYTPFLLMAALVSLWILFIITGPATQTDKRREYIKRVARGEVIGPANVLTGTVYWDSQCDALWYIQNLYPKTAAAESLEIVQTDGGGKIKYFAERALWNGRNWNLLNVRKIRFAADGEITESVYMNEIPMLYFNTPPASMEFSLSKPSQMTFSQLNRFLNQPHPLTSFLAPYKTEWHYQIVYPVSAIILLLFAMVLNGHEVRTSPAAGVFNAIFILLAYMGIFKFFLALGRTQRLPAWLAVWFPPLFFMGLALWVLDRRTHWVRQGRGLLMSWGWL